MHSRGTCYYDTVTKNFYCLRVFQVKVPSKTNQTYKIQHGKRKLASSLQSRKVFDVRVILKSNQPCTLIQVTNFAYLVLSIRLPKML